MIDIILYLFTLGRRGVDYTRDHSRSISPSYRSGDSLLRGNQRG